MPWQLPKELAERVERARRLLAESEAHRGSADLQHYLESAALSELLHWQFLDADGAAQRDLSAHDKQQGLVLHLLWSLNRLQDLPHVPQLDMTCQLCLHMAAAELVDGRPTGRAALDAHAPWLLGAWCLMAMSAGDAEDAHRLLQKGLLSSWDGVMPALLQRYQQQQGFQPAISADLLHQLFLLLRCEVRQGLEAHSAEVMGAAQKRALAAEQAADYAQLCQLQPGSHVYLLERAFALWRAEAEAEVLPACIAAVQAAKTANSSTTSCKATILAVYALLREGISAAPAARLDRARSLLATARSYLAQLGGWASPDLLENLQLTLARLDELLPPGTDVQQQQQQQQQAVGAAEARAAYSPADLRRPESEQRVVASRLLHLPPQPAKAPSTAQQLQAHGQPPPPQQQLQQQLPPNQPAAAERCSHCGHAVPSPAHCGRCHTTAYCGRRCQVQHWLGGHREECTRIVTQRFNERVVAVARARGGGGRAGNGSGIGELVAAAAGTAALNNWAESGTSSTSLD